MKIPYLDEEVAPGVVVRRYSCISGAFVPPPTEAERLIMKATARILGGGEEPTEDSFDWSEAHDTVWN